MIVVVPALRGVPVAVQIKQAQQELTARPIKLAPGRYTVAEVIDELAKQTGNTVHDARRQKDSLKIDLVLDGLTFWQALEALAAKVGCGFTPYGSHGGVTLVDAPSRARTISEHGIFRTVVKRVAVVRDEETGTAHCTAFLDVAWEPRFQPFYLGVGPANATFAPDAKGRELTSATPNRGQVSVAGRGALEFEVRLDAPDRSADTLAKFDGNVKLIGPSKMLTLTLPELKAGAAKEQEEVKVRVTKVKPGPDRWIVTVQIDNPEGTPEFESFQTWLDNNRAKLVQTEAGKTQTWLPEPNERVNSESPRKAVLEYAFAQPAGKGTAADWSLVVTTPGRIVEVTVPYSFRGVRLP